MNTETESYRISVGLHGLIVHVENGDSRGALKMIEHLTDVLDLRQILFMTAGNDNDFLLMTKAEAETLGVQSPREKQVVAVMLTLLRGNSLKKHFGNWATHRN